MQFQFIKQQTYLRRRGQFVTRITVLVTLLLGLLADAAIARPYRGQIALSVILCTFADSQMLPHDADFYRRMVIGQGNGSLADYWHSVSYGGVDFANAVVSGWHQEPLTIAQARAKSGGSNPKRGELVDDCLTAARNDPAVPYTVPSGNIVVAITHPEVDLYGGGGRAFLPATIDIGGLGHEIGHGLQLNHSFSNDLTYRNSPWSAIGEYGDPWDVMSWANVHDTSLGEFGSGGPGLNAYHRDRMGWLPRNRILTFGADGLTSATLTMAALNQPEADGYLLVRVPFEPSDPFHYFTIEFRKHDGWDAGIPSDIVLIHEVDRRSDGQYYTYLLRDPSDSHAPIQSLNRDGVTIQVNPSASGIGPNQALVTVHSEIAERCLMGYVWREAYPNDKICVPSATRQQAREDNVQAIARRNPNGGAYGPDTCLQGYVWREADTSDWVCVTPQVRTRTRQDNAAAASRRNPNGGPYGPDTCLQGFVWRDAFHGDHICVFPVIRTQAAADNREAPNRLMTH